MPAWAPVATGLKVRGDGVEMPEGEGADCDAWPFIPKKEAALKLCLRDGTRDAKEARAADEADDALGASAEVGALALGESLAARATAGAQEGRPPTVSQFGMAHVGGGGVHAAPRQPHARE